jgi:TonB family protein
MIKKTLFILALILQANITYSQDIIVVEDEVKKEESPLTFAVIEDVPIYPGCEEIERNKKLECFTKKVTEHIKTTFVYPKKARKNNIEGRVLVRFIINQVGEISNIETKGGDPILQTEALRIVRLLPKMKPGMQRGKPVKVKYSLPIVFKL